MNTPEQLRILTRQHLETIQLLGVGFVPIRGDVWISTAAEPLEEGGVGSMQSNLGKSASTIEQGHKLVQLDALRSRHDADCMHCTTATYHRKTVFGEGNPDAEIMFIGEAPGEEEDRTGRPFVGRAGQKLDDIIRAMGFSRADVYIANVLKSRPPENRTPLQHEVDVCSAFLREQIRIIMPSVIVALGGPAAKILLRTETGITRLRGQWGWYEDQGLQIPLMPTFHPAYMLRNYTVDTRQKVWSDMQAVLARLGRGPA